MILYNSKIKYIQYAYIQCAPFVLPAFSSACFQLDAIMLKENNWQGANAFYNVKIKYVQYVYIQCAPFVLPAFLSAYFQLDALYECYIFCLTGLSCA